MKGIHVNVPGATERIRELNGLLGQESFIASAGPDAGLDLHVDYHPEDWPEGPIFSDPARNLLAAGSGWFSYRNKPGNLGEFAGAFAAALERGEAEAVARDIEAGAFVLFIRANGKHHVLTDPFGLHPHYYVRGWDPVRLAPSPAFLGETARNPLHESALERLNHLFGNLTAYDNVLRLEPGCITTGERATPYFDYSPGDFDAEVFFKEISRIIGLFPSRKKVLPLSGGLDSRLLLSCGSFDYAYTFGPETTGDRPVARKLRKHFKRYEEFSLLDLSYPARFRKAGKILFDGTCKAPFLELLPVYHHVRDRFGKGCLLVDGYGGDVLQRAIYLTHDGFRGTLTKFFPALMGGSVDPAAMLKQRYGGLGREEMDLLLDEFEEKTGRWALDPARRLILFELLYVRGSRLIVNGAGTMSMQFLTTIQPFMTPRVFPIFFGLDPMEGRTFRNVQRIWKSVSKELSDIKTYAGFRPTWHPAVSRTVNFGAKALGKLGVVSGTRGYEEEVKRIRWEDG